MTINEQIKILDNKIRSNQAQYDLNSQNAKTSALISGELDKYEYLTGEDLGYKPDVVQKAKFEYSPLGQVFNKRLKTDEKQVGLLRRLKNIEDKTDDQLKESKDNQLGIKSIGYTIKEKLSKEAKNMLEKLNNQEKHINYQKPYLKGGNNHEYDFSDYRSLEEFFKTIYYRKITIEEDEAIQEEFDGVYGALEKYKPKKESYVGKRGKLLINAKNFYEGRQMIIDVFKDKIFPLVPTGFEDDVHEGGLLKKRQEEDGRLLTIEEEPEDISTLEQMTRLDKIYAPLFRRYFMENSLIEIMKKLKEYKEDPEKLQMYNGLITRLNIGLKKLKNDMENMSEDKVENRKLDYLRDLVRKIIDTSQKLGEEKVAQGQQEGQGLKKLNPQQMITRLPISLARLKAGNNSQKLKNEIRQIVYSLYRSKKLSKTVYNHLISTI